MADIFSQLLFRPTADQAAGLQRSHLVMQAVEPSKLEEEKTNHLPAGKSPQSQATMRSAAYAPPLHHHSKTEQDTMLDEAQDPALKPEEEKETKPWFGDDGFTFLDVLDAINPLQNIPLVIGGNGTQALADNIAVTSSALNHCATKTFSY